LNITLKPALRVLYFGLLPLVCFLTLVVAAPLRLIRRRLSAQMNSLWAGTPILTLPIKARAESLLGVNAKSLVYGSYGIADYGFDLHLGRFVRIPVLGRLVPLFAFFYAAVTQDRLHFFCDQALLPSNGRCVNKHELAVYRRLGIQIFFWVYGGDIRTRTATKELGEPNCCTFCPAVGSACICADNIGRRNYEVVTRYATAVFSMGDMIHYTPGSRNDAFFWPVDLSAQKGEKYKPDYPGAATNRAIRIVHAANHRHFKGTRFLIEAVEELKAEGRNIELVLVEGMPNDQAVAFYRSADIIFDQCLIGFYGYFALEGMAIGKPVMSFIRKPDQYLLNNMECPIVNTHVTTLKEDIRRLMESRVGLAEIGRRGRKYIESYFTPEAFADRLKLAYRDLGVMHKG
jgi:hypothetical protein